jgi:lipopolysaccharide transport system ATP-binding protein
MCKDRDQPSNHPNHIWALRDVAFDIKAGEVIGLIGRNGAGKSTLLKVLSRVTEPTLGRVALYGRVGSLLEVGTGFHPELTGRENIYLNGAILGMKRREIDEKFDEIVAFAEIEQFLDTPVKRYSNGMYVRLAFAVASHLDPEILIIDEVLSVGDSAFQKKCLKRIEDIGSSGKTILLVTHQMTLCSQVCTRAIHLQNGKVVADGPVDQVVRGYQEEAYEAQDERQDLEQARRRTATLGGARLLNCRLTSPGKEAPWIVPYSEPIELALGVAVERRLADLALGIALCTAPGFEVASSLSIDAFDCQVLEPGRYEYRVKLPDLKLAPGGYYFGFGLRSRRGTEDHIPLAAHFDVSPTLESTAALVHLRRGTVIPDLECSLSKV